MIRLKWLVVVSVCFLVFGGSSASLAQELLWMRIGPEEEAAFGRTMESIGDVDADGFSDFLVGGNGRIHLLSGLDGSDIRIHTLDSTGFGHRVSPLGDVDQDGVEDYAAGDFMNNDAWVFSGHDGSVLYHHTHEGPQRMGGAVCAAGDWNGDGAGDYWIGFPGQAAHIGQLSVSGYIQLFSGRDGEGLLKLEPSEDAGSFGNKIVRLGDLNGDSVDEIAVGAYLESKAWVFSGSDGQELFAWKAEFPDEKHYGWDIVSPGDVDGDSIPDVLICDPGWDVVRWYGGWYLYSGRTGELIDSEIGERIGLSLGYSICATGDVNQDGAEDWLVGVTGKRNTFGSARLYSGRTYSGGGAPLLYEFSPLNLRLGDVTPWFGTSVSTSPDLDGDGFAELRVGAARRKDQAINTGAVYVFRGNDLFFQATPSTVRPGESFSLRLGQAHPGASSLMVITQVEGTPCFCPILGMEPLGKDGFRRMVIEADPAWIGLDIRMRAYVLDPEYPTGSDILDSAEISVSFRR